jgi:hypothetical protein
MRAKMKKRRKGLEDILHFLVVQGSLASDGDRLFKYSSGVDQNDLVEEAPRYCNKKVGMMQLTTILPAAFEIRVTL